MSNGWGFGSFFGGSARAQKDTTKNAILQLRGTLDMLSKRERHIQNQMEEQDNVARKNVSTNKTGRSRDGSGGLAGPGIGVEFS